MQGNCEEAPGALGLSGAAMLPLKPRQCVLVADGGVLAASAAALWLQGLYVRLHRSTGGTFNYFVGALLWRGASCVAWRDTSVAAC